jgi:V/A-type H+/Na+-transporting ATPase subunit C
MNSIVPEETPKKIRLSGGGYPYAYARVSAMRGALIPRSEYHKLLKLELGGITRYLEETTYKRAIDRLGVTYSGIDLIEHALNLDMVETAQKLKRITPPEVNILIDAFMGRWDVHNIKTLIRGISSGATKEHIRSLFVPAGNLGEEELDSLLELGTVEAVLEQYPLFCAGQPGASEPLEAALEEFRQSGSLASVENALDRDYYAWMLSVADRLSAQGASFSLFLQEEVDVLNIKTLLRLKRIGLAKEKIVSHLILSGRLLDERTLGRLAGADSLQTIITELAAALSRTEYAEVFAKAAAGSLVDIELELERRLIKRSFLYTRQYPLSVMSIMSFMLAKVTEMNNLRMLVKAKQLGIEDEFIEQKIVVV